MEFQVPVKKDRTDNFVADPVFVIRPGQETQVVDGARPDNFQIVMNTQDASFSGNSFVVLMPGGDNEALALSSDGRKWTGAGGVTGADFRIGNSRSAFTDYQALSNLYRSGARKLPVYPKIPSWGISS